MDLITSSFVYVSGASFFWASMGFTTAVAMFVGAIIYDGEIPRVKRGLVSVLAYGGMLTWTTLARTIPIYFEKFHSQDPATFKMNEGQIFANPVTILFITLFWLLGIYLGVKIINKVHKKAVI